MNSQSTNTLRKLIWPVIGGLIAGGVGAYWYFSPYLVMQTMRSAVINADADEFNDHVDYPKLRESLKGQLSARISEEFEAQSRSGNEFERAGTALGGMLGLALVDKMVDGAVRPEAVMRAMKNGHFQLRNKGLSEDAKKTAALTDISLISVALKLYKLDHGVYPTQAQGLQILADPSARPDGDGGYLEKLPTDPWGRPYQYAIPGSGSAEFEVSYLPPPQGDDTPKAEKADWRIDRKGTDKVFVYAGSHDAASSNAGAAFVLRREGFANWKLTEIRLPD